MTIHSRFVRETSGNVAMSFALAILPMVGLAGAALDYSQASPHGSSSRPPSTRPPCVRPGCRGNRAGPQGQRLRLLPRRGPGGVRPRPRRRHPATDGSLAAGGPPRRHTRWTRGVTGQTVSVTATRMVKTSVMGIFGQSYTYIPVTAQATALRTIQGPPICVLAISKRDPAASGAITVARQRRGDRQGLRPLQQLLRGRRDTGAGLGHGAGRGLLRGGRDHLPPTLTPRATQGCDRRGSLRGQVPGPVTTGCDFNNVRSARTDRDTLAGDLLRRHRREGHGHLPVRPLRGEERRPRHQRGRRRLRHGVTFYLTGTNAGFDFNGSGALTMAAPTDGTYSGHAGDPGRGLERGPHQQDQRQQQHLDHGRALRPEPVHRGDGNGTFGSRTPSCRWSPIVCPSPAPASRSPR
jgi:hypothetical protein